MFAKIENMIKVGDVVEIKSGSVGMTVISLNGEVANCLWVVDGTPNQIEVPVFCLTLKGNKAQTYNSGINKDSKPEVSETYIDTPNHKINSSIYNLSEQEVKNYFLINTNEFINKPVGLIEFEKLDKSTQAFHLLCERVKELNGENHKFNWSDGSKKWCVFWNMETNSFFNSRYRYSCSSVSARLCLKSEELCKQLVKENTELLKDFFAVD